MMVEADVHADSTGAKSKRKEVGGCEVDENDNHLGENEVSNVTHKLPHEKSSSLKHVVHLTLKAPDMLEEVIGLQGLLLHFSNLQVRADFVNGKFGPNIDPRISSLDELRW